MSFLSGFFDTVKSVVSGVVDILLTPVNAIMDAVSDVASDNIRNITDAIGETGIGDIASSAVDGVSGALGGIVDTAGNVIDKGTDSFFGAVDVMKYVPYVVLGIGGIFVVKYGKDIISETGSTVRSRR